MATHDYVIANASGAAVRADLNNALAAIVSNNSSATAPATTYAYQWWADTTANQLKLRNTANDAWIVIRELDGTMSSVTLKNSTQEDTDGGRESSLIFQGEQSGGEISALAQLEASHDGTADDEKGKLVISTNDGSDGASPTAALTISSDQTVAVADNLTVNGNQYPTAGALSNRNLCINGSMQVAQRGTSFATNNAGNFAVDRFNCNASTNTTITFSQETDAPVGFANSLKATITSANSSRTAGDTNYVLQAIEGNNFGHLNFGSANAKTFTLSFYVKSSVTGTYGVGFANNGSSRVRHTTYTINAANTWERKTVTVPGDTSGTWLTNNGVGLIPVWDLGMGTDFESNTVDTWDANANYRRSSDVNLSLTASATWQITGVQLELGTKATPFEHRNYGDELAKCQRYYTKVKNIGSSGFGAFAIMIMASTATDARGVICLPTTMRQVPTLGYSALSDFQFFNLGGGSPTAIALSDGGTSGTFVGISANASTTQSVNNTGVLRANNNNNAYIDFDAEL